MNSNYNIAAKKRHQHVKELIVLKSHPEESGRLLWERTGTVSYEPFIAISRVPLLPGRSFAVA
jgi:hypothetical protein